MTTPHKTAIASVPKRAVTDRMVGKALAKWFDYGLPLPGTPAYENAYKKMRAALEAAISTEPV